jgi:hypothetical protein
MYQLIKYLRKLRFAPKVYSCISCYSQNKQQLRYFPKSTNQLVPVIDTQSVFCEVGIESLSIIYKH